MQCTQMSNDHKFKKMILTSLPQTWKKYFWMYFHKAFTINKLKLILEKLIVSCEYVILIYIILLQLYFCYLLVANNSVLLSWSLSGLTALALLSNSSCILSNSSPFLLTSSPLWIKSVFFPLNYLPFLALTKYRK